MSSLLEKLAEKGLAQVRERGPEWVEKLIEEGRELLPPPGDEEGAAVHDMGTAALNWLEQNKGRVSDLGMLGLQAFVGYVALGDAENATLVFLARGADWDQLHDAVDAAADEVQLAAEARAQALAFIKSMGTAIGKALLPILLAVNPLKLPL